MSKSLNKVTLIGHVGKDAELRYTGSGTPVASFTMATSDSWKDKASGQLQERTEWHNIVAWSPLAEICGNYVKKGKKLYIEGRIQTRTYDDKDGNKKYFTDIVMREMIFLDSAGGSGSGGNGEHNSFARPNASSSSGPGAPPVPADFEHSAPVEDDLPF